MNGTTDRPAAITGLDNFLSHHPSIKVSRPSDPDFESKTETWIHLPVPWPRLALRPQSEADVSSLIRELTSQNIPFAMRGAGHDFSIRSRAAGGVQVDMRDIAHVRVSADRKTARIGAGIRIIDAITELEKEGLMCTSAANGMVGFAGWAGLGGYGPFSALFGLGCDQIVNARVVLWDGRVIDADERLLKGIRGALPAFGAVVELEIKVYPTREVHGGYIVYAGEGLSLEEVVSTWFTNFSANPLRSDGLLPPQLRVMPLMVAFALTPGQADQNQSFIVKLSWTGPADEEWHAVHEKLKGFAPGALSNIVTSTAAEYVRSTDEPLPPRMYGGCVATLSLRGIYPSPESIRLIAEQAATKPMEGIYTGHMYQEPLDRATNPAPPNVYRTREPHYLIQLLGYDVQPGKGADAAGAWSRQVEAAVSQSPDALEGRYFSITEKEDVKIEKTYSKEDLEFLRELKREYDPHNFFQSVPLLSV